MFSFFNKEPLYHYHMDKFIIKSPVIYRDSHLIIHVGGGPNRNHPKEVNLNIMPMENVDIVGTAEALPFKEKSVDVIISNAVLEHVKDLPKTIQEFDRVLKPGGFIYIEIPFMQHYHTHDIYGVTFEDYRRLTKTGLIDILNFCYPIDVGVCVGPTSTLFQIIFTYLEDLYSKNTYKRLVKKLYNLIGNLFVWIDEHLPEKVINNSKIPSGIYYFGIKHDERTAILEKLPKPNSIFPKSVSAEIALLKNDKGKMLIKVKNTSDTTWIKDSPFPWGTVNVGIQRILNDKVDIDFKRIPIPHNIEPGNDFDIAISLNDLRGSKYIKIDMVIEGICWFEQYGNKPFLIPY